MERRSPLTKLQTEVADSLRWPLGTELYFYWELLYGIVIWNCYMELLLGTCCIGIWAGKPLEA